MKLLGGVFLCFYGYIVGAFARSARAQSARGEDGVDEPADCGADGD